MGTRLRHAQIMNLSMENEYRERLHREARRLLIALAVGAAYGLWCSLTKIGIPCVIHTIFHVQCPGCGMTRAAVSIMHLHFSEAFSHNALSLTVMPVLLVVLAVQEARYIKTGKRTMTIPETVIIGILFYASVFYGIARNF